MIALDIPVALPVGEEDDVVVVDIEYSREPEERHDGFLLRREHIEIYTATDRLTGTVWDIADLPPRYRIRCEAALKKALYHAVR